MEDNTPPPAAPEPDRKTIMIQSRQIGKTLSMMNANDSWAQVELHRWQYGELPSPTDARPLIISEGLRNMAKAIETGCAKDATDEARKNMPSPFNVVSVMLYVARIQESIDKAHGWPPKPTDEPQTKARPSANTPRNSRCPCGSGLKFKRCCGS